MPSRLTLRERAREACSKARKARLTYGPATYTAASGKREGGREGFGDVERATGSSGALVYTSLADDDDISNPWCPAQTAKSRNTGKLRYKATPLHGNSVLRCPHNKIDFLINHPMDP